MADDEAIEALTSEIEADEEQERLDVEVALLAALAARDVGSGEPTEAVDLASLSPVEKQALVALIRERLEMKPPSEGSDDAAPATGTGMDHIPPPESL